MIPIRNGFSKRFRRAVVIWFRGDKKFWFFRFFCQSEPAGSGQIGNNTVSVNWTGKNRIFGTENRKEFGSFSIYRIEPVVPVTLIMFHFYSPFTVSLSLHLRPFSLFQTILEPSSPSRIHGSILSHRPNLQFYYCMTGPHVSSPWIPRRLLQNQLVRRSNLRRLAVGAMIVISQDVFCVNYIIFVATTQTNIFNFSINNPNPKILGFSGKSVHIAYGVVFLSNWGWTQF